MDNSCSCQTNNMLGLSSLKASHDFTLKKGDLVNHNHQIVVFSGSNSFPFKEKDFVAVSNLTILPKMTADFLEHLKDSDHFKQQANLLLKSNDVKNYALIPVKSINDGQVANNYTRIEGVSEIRNVNINRASLKKHVSFQEFLAERQKSVREFEALR